MDIDLIRTERVKDKDSISSKLTAVAASWSPGKVGLQAERSVLPPDRLRWAVSVSPDEPCARVFADFVKQSKTST